MNWYKPQQLDVFPPDVYRFLVCERSPAALAKSPRQSLNRYAIDMFTGKRWRNKNNAYVSWALVPTVGLMQPRTKSPEPGRLSVICLSTPNFFGLYIGKTMLIADTLLWHIYIEHSVDLIAIPVHHVDGWLLLP